LLKIIAGLLQADSGEVVFEEAKVKGPLEKLLPGHPKIAYLSQHFELRNNYRVSEILQMSNKISAVDAELIYQVCKIDHLLSRWTDELSGGERQRVSFAKALVGFPKLILMDEPFSNLDAIHREVLKSIILDIEQRLNVSFLLVSHDPSDLLSWADEIIVLHEGKVIQRGSGQEIYYYPFNEYTAALFGAYNLTTPALAELFPCLPASRRIVRPSEFQINSNAATGIKGEIMSIQFMGNYFQYGVKVSGHKLIIATGNPYRKDDNIFVSYKLQQSLPLE
jgi:ABC-type sugar transport system ATPase subunit